MSKTITITDPEKVKAGDKAYFKGCDFGFTVLSTDNEDHVSPLMVHDPLTGCNCWTYSSRFDHATREVGEPGWPDPHDIKLHIYLGADGRRYICNPCSEQDTCPWTVENSAGFYNRQRMAHMVPEALPLTELKLVPAKNDESNDTGITIVCNLTADPEKHTTRRNNA